MLIAGLAVVLTLVAVAANARFALLEAVAAFVLVGVGLGALMAGEPQAVEVRGVMLAAGVLLGASGARGPGGAAMRLTALGLALTAAWESTTVSAVGVASWSAGAASAEAVAIALAAAALAGVAARASAATAGVFVVVAALVLGAALTSASTTGEGDVLVDIETGSAVSVYVVSAFAESDTNIQVIERQARLPLTTGLAWLLCVGLAIALSFAAAIATRSSSRAGVILGGVAALVGLGAAYFAWTGHVVVPDGIWHRPQAPVGDGDELGVLLLPEVGAAAPTARSVALLLNVGLLAALGPLFVLSRRRAPESQPAGFVAFVVLAMIASAIDVGLGLQLARPTVVDVSPLDLAPAAAALALGATLMPPGWRRTFAGVAAAALLGVTVALVRLAT
jgi:hypothetical protein